MTGRPNNNLPAGALFIDVSHDDLAALMSQTGCTGIPYALGPPCISTPSSQPELARAAVTDTIQPRGVDVLIAQLTLRVLNLLKCSLSNLA